jgi:hypothetical protein
MFITSKEKDWMMASIQILQQQVKELEEKFAKYHRVYTTEEAPWGLKKDGTPCKRPGRAQKSKVQP